MYNKDRGDSMERIQKVIASSGVTSRRKAEELIMSGRVSVNGKTISTLGVKVSSKDKIEVDGVVISKSQKVYYLLNKPRGVISSAQDEKGRKTVVDLIDTSARIYPVGRLDYDTTGVLLLTNDGEFSNILMHPCYEIDKVYMAKIRGIITGADIRTLKEGVSIDEKTFKASKVKLRKVDSKTNTSMVEIIIHEGYHHQVKKMFSSLGYEVLKLKRERVGIFTLAGLKSGAYRKLTPKEVQTVYSLAKKK